MLIRRILHWQHCIASGATPAMLILLPHLHNTKLQILNRIMHNTHLQNTALAPIHSKYYKADHAKYSLLLCNTAVLQILQHTHPFLNSQIAHCNAMQCNTLHSLIIGREVLILALPILLTLQGCIS